MSTRHPPGEENKKMRTNLETTRLPDDWTVYAETPNGREIREAKVDGHSRFFVQPHNDNYWICTRTPKRALRAYYHPEEFRQSAAS
jgi:hypothetical protein